MTTTITTAPQPQVEVEEAYAARDAAYERGDYFAYNRLDLEAKRIGTTGLLARLRSLEPNPDRRNR